MRKGPYFVFQAIMSFIISSLIWYMCFNFLGIATNALETISSATFSPFIVLLIGGVFYILLTVVYIIIGVRRIFDWRPWILGVNIAIHISMFFLGFMGGSYFAAITMAMGAPEIL